MRKARCESGQEASDLLVQTAFNMGSGDNISVIVIYLARWHRAVGADHRAKSARQQEERASLEGGTGIEVSAEEVERRIAAAVASVEMEEEALETDHENAAAAGGGSGAGTGATEVAEDSLFVI